MATFSKLSERKRSTFIKYSREIRQSVQYDREAQIVKFNYHLKRPHELKDVLDKTFAPIVFEVSSTKKVESMVELAAKMDKVEGKGGHNAVAEEITKIVRADDIWTLLSGVEVTIQKRAFKRSLRAELKYVLITSFFNCSRHSDLKNADPTKFELVKNRYLNRVLRVLVCETKTRKPRYIYFFPVNKKTDPLIALHDLFSEAEPVPKSRASHQKTDQEWQMLRDSLLTNYDRFIATHAKQAVFGIKHGPKSHLGRHLMSSYLSHTNHGQWVSPFGNWSAGKDTVESNVARAKYVHIQADIPDELFAFLSQYYIQTPSGDFELIDSSEQPTTFINNLSTQEDISKSYGTWTQVVGQDVLEYVHSYAMGKLGIRK
uniref:Recombinase Flp protein n=1 Tax=Lachancea fermentati TaxID=4955 RepID=FLP_LACFM|nr:RecName: Full=Recombinase Flp protein [Lachancea fermentati]AAA35279.1 FLP recombinase [Lachancea fermentati]